jgi:hypothetical protein
MKYVLFLITLPWSIVGWVWILALRISGLVTALHWENDRLLMTAVFTPLATKYWHFSTALARSIAYQPGARALPPEPLTQVQEHEHVHIRQTEDRMTWSLFLGLVLLPIVGQADLPLGFLVFFIVWISGGFSQVANWLTAAMRGGDAYRDSEHEMSAYAQTDRWGPDGKAWTDVRTK